MHVKYIFLLWGRNVLKYHSSQARTEDWASCEEFMILRSILPLVEVQGDHFVKNIHIVESWGIL